MSRTCCGSVRTPSTRVPWKARVKHVDPTSVSVYLHEPAEGIGVEFANGHAKIADESLHRRLLKAGPTTVNGWSGGFPDRLLGEPASAPRAGQGGGTAAAALASASGPQPVTTGV